MSSIASHVRFLLAALFFATAGVHAQSLTRFDLPAQPLVESLKAVASQTSVNVFFEPKLVAGRQARALKAQVSTEEALKRLLTGTGLTYQQVDAKTITIVPVPNTAASARTSDESMRLVQGAPVDAPPQKVDQPPAESQEQKQATESETAPDPESTTEVQVTGSRIRGLLGEQTIQPVLTITHEDIERYGVSSLGEVLKYIPQLSGVEQGQAIQDTQTLGAPQVSVTVNRIAATLRGAPPGGTLLLVNGRRVAKNGQAGAFGGNDAYDLGGIPLSAVERIDVLLDGASAVYGADAVGGVINVILKKNYRGTEARVSYENTFDTDVSVKTASLSHGFAFGKLSGLVNASWESANNMTWADRWFLQSLDRRPFGGGNYSYPFIYGGAGVIQSMGGNLPGLTTDTVAIPSGSTGTNLTIADYANAGPLPELFEPSGKYIPYSTPYDRKSIAGNAEYEFSPALTAFAEARWGKSTTTSTSAPPVGYMTEVPAGAPGNPFGVPVMVTKYFFDLPLPRMSASTQNTGYTAGLRGKLLQDWRYETAATRASTRPDISQPAGFLDPSRVAAAMTGPNPPVLLYDSTAGISPNPAGTLEALYYSPSPDAERSWTTIYDVQADGPLLALPAGKMQMSLGVEYRDERVEFPIPERTLSIQSNDRYTSGYYAELQVPLLSDKQSLPLIERLEANLAVRNDRYSDFPSSTNARYGLLYRPVRWLMLRGSRGKGYKVPTLVQLYQPVSDGATYFPPGIFFDSARGGETIDGTGGGFGMPVTNMGNPDLRPERSRNTTAGAVLELPFAPGLSFSFDYFDTQYMDRVASLSIEDRIALFPDTVIRGPNLPGDPAGWPGPVTSYIDIAYNIALNRVSGYDIGMKYYWPSRYGDWNFQATSSKTTRNEIRTAPGLPLTPDSTTLNMPLQVVGSLFWTRSALSLGALFTYRDASMGTTTSGPNVPSAIRWDWQGSYDFGQGNWAGAQGGSWLSHVLADTRLSLTIFNVLDKEPPFLKGFFLPDNTVVDSRMRRYSLAIVRKF